MLNLIDVCSAPLAESFGYPAWHYLGLGLAGVVGVTGYGLVYEHLCSWKSERDISLAHAFIEGTVLVSGILLVSSLLRLAHPARLLCILGILFFAATLLVGAVKHGWSWFRLEDRVVLKLLLAVFTLPLAIFFLGHATGTWDTFAIWAFHGKALTCYPLFQSPLHQNVFAGTNADYPVFFGLMHSFFFKLSNSFRDDAVKIWQSATVVALIVATYDTALKAGLSRFRSTALCFCVLYLLMRCIWEPTVEFSCYVFALLAGLSLYAKDWPRFCLYTFGLAFTKNEGLVSAAALIFISSIAFLRRPAGERLRVLTPLILIVPWILVLVQFPKGQMNYPSRAVSAEAWSEGLANIGVIIRGCWTIVASKHWWIVLLSPVLLICFGWRRKETIWLHLWAVCMMGVFLMIYVVSPFWGATLYEVTLTRLLTQLIPPVIVASFLDLDLLSRARAPWLSRSATVVVVVAFLGCGLLTLRGMGRLTIGVISKYREDGTILSREYDRGPFWKRALEIDKSIAPASKGALLDEKWYFHIAYALFPRLLYPGSPSQARIPMPYWVPWSHVSDSEYAANGFRFILRKMPGESNYVIERAD